MVAMMSTTPILKFIGMFDPIAKHQRVLYDAPRIGIQGEYLRNELMKYMDEHPELATY